MMFKLS
jgi:hypothetical protein